VTAKPREVDKKVISMSVGTFVTCLVFIVGLLVPGIWAAAVAFQSIDNRLAAAWTIEDAQRQQNWLRQDNSKIGLVVRDTDDVVNARYVKR